MKVLDIKFHDLNTDRVSFVYDLMKFFLNVNIKTFVKELLRKRTLIFVKALP